MISVIRHGDMFLEEIEKLPEGLIEAKTNVLMMGSHGNPHSFENGKFYPHKKGQFVVGYLEAGENCKLLHPEHGKVKNSAGLMEADIPAGIYQIRKQQEDTHQGMKPVID